MNRFGYNNLINGVTRKTENTASCIDHLFIRCKDENYSKITPVILKRDLTDHYPILLNLKLKNKLTDTTQKNKLYSKIDYALLSQTISTAKWDSVFSETNAETSTTNFIESFTDMIKSCTKEYKFCKKKVRLKPWITEGLILSIRKRDQLKKLLSQNPNNIIMQNNYKHYRTILSNLIKKTKYQYYKNKLQSNKGDIKKTWDTIKEVTNEKTNKRDINIILNANGEMISDLGQIASEFNSYFCNIGHQLARNINPTDKNFKEKSETCSESCYLTPITANELIDLISSLKNNVKGEEDQIAAEILKQNHKDLLAPLLHIINCILSTGVFPSILRKAIIVPVFKHGNEKLTSNYRPIALTSTVSKLVEKCIKIKLQSFFEKKDILSNSQYAFKRNSSTEHCLVRVTEMILGGLDVGNRVVGIFLDLKKAFDTVAHHLLLQRLHKIGIRGIVYRLIESYLKDRTKKVKIGDTISEPQAVVCGVPQGTVLGPILFNVYVNDVLSILDEEGAVFCFADDTVIIVQGETWETVIKKSEIAVSNAMCWLEHSLLSLNIEKTKFLTFAHTSRTLPTVQRLRIHNVNCDGLETCVCGNKIERVESIKYLGVFLDQKLNWKDHIYYVTKKVRKLIHKFFELRHILSSKMLKIVYASLIESIITYGIVAWGGASKTSISPLQIAQKYVIKIMLLKNRRYPMELLFQVSKLLTVEQLYIKSVIRFMLTNTYYRNSLPYSHSRNIRNVSNQNLTLSFVRHSASQKHISYIGPRLFNLLPLSIRTKPFKKVKNLVNNRIPECIFSAKYSV
nr:unnamed protein product [Callosobruchus analis]